MSSARRNGAVAVAAAILVSVFAGEARAGAPRTHDGFFLRLSAGGGSAQTEIDVPGARTEFSGGSADLNFAIGAVIAPNLALHGTIYGWLVSDPDIEVDIDSLGSGSGTAEGDLDLTAYGVGLTYYFMPVNMYLSGTAGAGKLSIDSPNGDADSDTGFVGEIALGKEWWLGGGWGLGLAGVFGFHSIPDGDVDENWSGTSFGLRLSATMN